MADTTMIELIQELVSDYDSSIDTSSGSAFYTKVITPLMKRIGDDPLATDVELLVAAHLEENIDGIDVGEGSGTRDLIARPLTVGMEPYKRELAGIKVAASLDNYEAMTRPEVNSLLANFFTELKVGEKATVTARMYFTSAQTVVVTALSQFSTGSGLNFFPTQTQTITSTSMSFNQEGSLYYFDVTLEAEAAGESYNVDKGSIISVQGIAGVVRVTNKSAATAGDDDETKLEGITRAKESITIRNLAVLRGCRTVLQAEFSSIDDIEIVGMGDSLMLRDVITGPVDISGIPGGYVGADPSLVGSGQTVHIGGKTDIWLFTTTPTEESLDIENVTDQGLRVWAGTHGYTNPGSGPTTTFRDEYGRFSSRGVSGGDFLKLGEEVIEINSRTATTLTLASSIDPALSEQTYEIVTYVDRSVHNDGKAYLLTVPLWNLVAESDGSVVTDDDDDVVFVIPGSADLTAYTDGDGDYVKVTENIADANLELPLVRVKSVAFLDSLDLTETGDTIPLANILTMKALTAFEGGDASTKATGTVRIYFKDPVNFFVGPDFRFSPDGVVTYLVDYVSVSSGNYTIDSNSCEVSGDLTSDPNLKPGNRLYGGAEYWTIMSEPVYDGGSGKTTFDIREDSGTVILSSPDGLEGCLEADLVSDDGRGMALDAETGLYYIDLEAEATAKGSAGNQDIDTFMAVTSSTDSFFAEGYYLHAQESELAYSTKEHTYMALTRYVNDTKDLRSTSTSYVLRLTYDYAEGYQDLQDYVEHEDNRPVGEDILIRHMMPSVVIMSPVTDLDADDADEAVIDFLLAMDPQDDFEISDLVDELYAAGAEYVKMPLQGSVISCGRNRQWIGEHITDKHSTTRINHYLADTDSITSTEDS